MKKQVLCIHSAGPQEGNQGSSHLIAYLQQLLGTEYSILTPAMPDPENPNYARWKSKLASELAALNGEVILIGHSLGGSVLLKFLSEEACDLVIKGLFLLGSPYWGVDQDWVAEEFELPSDFTSTLPLIRHLFLYHSRDDDVVPLTHMEQYVRKLPHAKTRVFKHQGHLFENGVAELISDIQSL
ncbi:alpha/beta hydrolase [Thalassobacillus sp. CUG 92003]|uniref:RBBP9/YdeN family alpha/beta hydrolase n=1 Tax=Thalassobacillus sp. CUG 92003 TaxID=2736641 RepID=UPI0015E78F8F|nr:alpha/beta fold hydrolase [Thalassobacillus sp. CUG 92003]